MTKKIWNSILFDLDGTLIDSGAGVTNSVRYALTAFGKPIPSQKELDAFIGPPLEGSFCGLCGFAPEEVPKAIQKYREYYAIRGIRENTLYPGIEPLLAHLRENGKTLYVATSKPTLYAKQILRDFGIADFFCDIVGSEMASADQNKADIIAKLIKAHDIAPKSTVMVGDRRFDVEGARQNNIETIGILFGGYGTRQELVEAGAAYIVEDVPTLAAVLTGGALETERKEGTA